MTTPTPAWSSPALPALHVRNSNTLLPVRRVFCVGRNYQSHAIEMGTPVDKASMQPFYFLKDSFSLMAAKVDQSLQLPYPPVTANFHHEAELVVVIGKAGFELDPAAAQGLIYGYAPGLDMTRRDLQQVAKDSGRPWDVAKNFEHGALCGEVVPAGAMLENGRIALRVNGELRQQADLGEMIWNIAELIADLSCYYHLQPGDLLFTGTPEGVGPVQPGDQLEVDIEAVGRLAVEVRTA